MAGVSPKNGGNRCNPAILGQIPKPQLPTPGLQVSGGGGTVTPANSGNRIHPAVVGQIPKPNIPTPGLQVGG